MCGLLLVIPKSFREMFFFTVFDLLFWYVKLNGNLLHGRVMTVSFHKYGDLFFPGTGDVKVLPSLLLHIILSVPAC